MKACFLVLVLSLGIWGRSGEGMAQVVFQEDFDIGTELKGWIGSEDWTVEEGRLKHAPVESLKKESLFLHEVGLTDLEYKDFEWTLTVRNEGVNSSNYFRFCLLALAPDADADMLYFKVSGTDGSDFRFVIRENGKEKVFSTGIRWDKTKAYRFSIIWDEWGVQVYQQQIGQTRSIPVFFYSIAEIPVSFYGKKLYSGVIFNYSSTGQEKFFLDDLKMTAAYKAGTFSGMQVADGKGLLLEYTLPLKAETYRNPGNYQVCRNGVPVVVDSVGTVGRNAVLLYLPLLTGEYTVTTQNLKTVAGDDVDIASESVSYVSPALPGDLCINEIMFAPGTEMFFDQEYIEIYNRQDYTLRLDSVTYVYRGKSVASIQDTIGGNGFLLLCSKEASGLLSPYGKTVGIPSFGLLNAGAAVGLVDKQGRYLDSLTYDPLWVRDKDKRKGYALERIHPDHFKGPESFNWYESQAFEGGTPGKENSVKGHCPDQESPWVTAYFLEGDSAFVVVFNETMYRESLKKKEHYMLTFQEHASSESFYPIERIETMPDGVRVICRPALLRNRVYRLALSGLQDLSGNFLRDTVLSVLFPGIPEVGDVVISELLFQAVPAGNRYVELYNRSDKKICPDDLKIGIREKKTNRLEQLKALSSKGFVLEPGGFCWICSEREAILQQYPRHQEENCIVLPAMPVFPALGGTVVLIHQDSVVIDSFSYLPDMHRADLETVKGVALERLHLEKKEDLKDIAVWTSAGGDEASGYGSPGLPNRAVPDVLTQVEIEGDSVVQVFYTVPIDSSSATDRRHYRLWRDEKEIPIDRIDRGNEVSVNLHLSLQTGCYELEIAGVKDIGGGLIPDRKIVFSYVAVAVAGNIRINEIMYRPREGLGLPAVEYVELYNDGKVAVRLDSVRYHYRDRVIDVLCDTIEAESYLLLCTSADADRLKAYGRVCKVKNFSLVDTGACLMLTAKDGLIMDSVFYRPEWIREPEKRKGGYALERIGMANTFPTARNWYASVAVEGGTPGRRNSIAGRKPDDIPPEIILCFFEQGNTIRLIFSEDLEKSSGINREHYFLEPGWGKPENVLDKGGEVVLTFQDDFPENQEYELQVKEVRDLAGNKMRDTLIRYYVFARPGPGEVLLSEILYEAEPADAEYIELYNPSGKRIRMSDLLLAKRGDVTAGMQYRKLTDSAYVLEPQALVWLSYAPQKVMDRYLYHKADNLLPLKAALQLNNSQGYVAVCFRDSTVLDEFSYSRELHRADFSKTKGIALERMDYENDRPEVWTSAGGNEEQGYGSPGLPNRAAGQSRITQETEAENQENSLITVAPEVFTPNADGYVDVVNICANFFSRKYILKLMVYSSTGRQIRKLADGLPIRRRECFSWDGTTENGRLLPAGIYVVYAQAVFDNGEKKVIRKVCVLSR